jgi:hypothetical protein
VGFVLILVNLNPQPTHLRAQIPKIVQSYYLFPYLHKGKERERENLERERKAEMGVVIIDGSTVRDFVSDEAQFKKSVDEQFEALDLNKDGVLSRVELRKAFESMRLIETHFGIDVATPPEQLTQLYDSIFEGFDCDKSGTVDREEFREEMKKIMMAIAEGLGTCPIQMALDDQSLLQRAADLEASKASSASKASKASSA